MRLFKGQGRNKAVLIAIVGINTAYIGQYQQLFSLQRTGNLASNAIRIDVIGFALSTHTSRSNNRNKACIQQYINQFSVNLFYIANIANIYQINLAIFINVSQMLLSLNQSSILAVQAHCLTTQGVQTSYQISVDFANQSHLCNAHGLSISYAQAAYELALLASLHQHAGDFRAAAVNNNRTHTSALQEHDILQHLVLQLVVQHSVAAIFNYDGFILKLAQIG